MGPMRDRDRVTCPPGSDRVGSEEVQHLLPWAHRNAQLLEVAFVQMDDGVEGDLLYGECLGKGAQAIGGEQRAQTIITTLST